MADQTQVDNRANGAADFGENVSGFAHDVTSLVELQVRLLAVDLRDAKRRSGPAIGLVLGGVVLLLGCVPVLLFAAAHVLIEFAGWPASGAYAAAAVTGLVVGGALGYAGWKKLMTAAGTLARSREELTETLQWLKRALKPNGTAGPQQARGYPSSRSRFN